MPTSLPVWFVVHNRSKGMVKPSFWEYLEKEVRPSAVHLVPRHMVTDHEIVRRLASSFGRLEVGFLISGSDVHD